MVVLYGDLSALNRTSRFGAEDLGLAELVGQLVEQRLHGRLHVVVVGGPIGQPVLP